MIKKLKRIRLRHVLLGFFFLLVIAGLSGCQTVKFYKQAIQGQYQILANQKPIRELIADTNTPPELKEKFEAVLKIREFAERDLKLPANQHYLKYVDLHRPYVVWNVTAAPELSLEAKTWWFPIVGRASYRGYFSEKAARDYAAQLQKKGYDVHVGGVETYSTLGWFRDPLLNTFIDESEADLAEIIFHELAHQKLFIASDTDFNEAFATAVAEEGLRRWFAAKKKPEALARLSTHSARKDQFVKLILATIAKLEAVYENPNLPDEVKRARKKQIIAELRAGHAKLKIEWGGKSGYDEWFAGQINNAQLNTVATYYELVPTIHALLEADGGDLEKFYQDIKRRSKLPKSKRFQP